MSAPRFRINHPSPERKKVFKRDFSGEGMPKIVKDKSHSNTWAVVGKYKIAPNEDLLKRYEEYSEQLSGDIEFESKYEKLKHEEYLWAVHNPGEESDIVKVYNPFTDAPEIFLEFASLGKNEFPDKGKILEFAHKYGGIFEPAIINCDIVDDEDISPEQGSSLEDFQREAITAYNALHLFESIISYNSDKVLKQVNFFIDNWRSLKLNNEIDIYDCATCEDAFPMNQLLKKNTFIKIFGEGDINYKNCNEYYESRCYPLKYILKEKLVMGFLYEAASDLLTEVLNRKLNAEHPEYISFTPVRPVCQFRFEYLNNRNTPVFYMSYSFPSLLQAIWLIFLFRVTNQIEHPYKICPVCELPIANPRKNQQYHDGCRQVLYNRNKRSAAKLWQEGKSPEEIAEIVDVKSKTLAGWIKAFEKQGSQDEREG